MTEFSFLGELSLQQFKKKTNRKFVQNLMSIIWETSPNAFVDRGHKNYWLKGNIYGSKCIGS